MRLGYRRRDGKQPTGYLVKQLCWLGTCHDRLVLEAVAHDFIVQAVAGRARSNV